ncbi:hypothetical protein TRVA0_051S00496 [Trichomonascus vanleenenianus]|uniref:PHP domain-containing protein n=1 Tax=Trichomonascus vanleenenianus TaxID=2268995 RepID=UPI003ECB2DEF
MNDPEGRANLTPANYRMSSRSSTRPSTPAVVLETRSWTSRYIESCIKTAGVLTVLISFSIWSQFANYPSTQTSKDVWYSDEFVLRVPDDLPTAELWDPGFINSYSPILLETHSHTTVSDGELSPEQLVDWAYAYGFNAIFVTDHNDIRGGLEARRYAEKQFSEEELLVVPGVEYTCCRIHMNLIGINETIEPPSSWPSNKELAEAIHRVHELGGFVLVNHLPWSMSTEHGRQVPTLQDHPTRDELLAMGVDGFESVSEGVLDLSTIRYSEAYGLPLFTATDIHAPDTAPTGWTVINAESRHSKYETIRRAFTRRYEKLTSFYYDPVGPKPQVYSKPNPSYHKYAPLRALDMSFLWFESKGMYSFVSGFCHDAQFDFYISRAVYFIAYCFIAVAIYETVLYAMRRYFYRYNKLTIHLD